MNFTEIRTAALEYLALSSTDAIARIGKAINRHHRRVTSELGMEATRFVTRNMAMTVGVATVTFTSIEKIDRILDVTSGRRLIDEISLDELRPMVPGTGTASLWALQSVAADTVTALFDTQPQTAYDLQADGWTSLSDLSGTDEPVFSESFHDILTWSVISEELLKKEKDKLAREYERKAEKLLNELKFHYADSPGLVTRQGNRPSATGSGTSGSSGGGGAAPGLSYTQTGLITFDRDPSAPFAVSASSAVVPNLDADLLDGQHGSFYTNAANISTGTLPLARLVDITNTEISASAAIARSKLNFGSGLVNADIAAAAAIAYSKLNLATSIVNADISAAAAIASSKVDLSAVAQDLKFTDATYDIGKTGATRPRDFFLSRNATVGGTLTVSGVATAAAQPRAAVYHNTTQSLNNTTFTTIAFNSEDFDVGTMHDTVTNNSRLTIPTGGGGLYLVKATVVFTPNATGMRAAQLLKNGAVIGTFATMLTVGSSAGEESTVHVTQLLELAAADYLEVQGYQASGGALNVGHASSRERQPSFFAVKLW